MLAPSYRQFCRLLLLSILLLLVQPFFGLAAETIRSDGRLPITAETFKSKIETVSQATELDQESKDRLLDLYRKGLDNLSTAKTNNDQAKALVALIETAPAEIQKLKQALEREVVAGTAGDALTGTAAGEPRPLNELEQELIKAKATTTEIEAKFTEFTRQSTFSMTDRPRSASGWLISRIRRKNSSQARMRCRWPRILPR